MGNEGIFKGVAGEWRYGQGGRCLKKFDDPWFKWIFPYKYILVTDETTTTLRLLYEFADALHFRRTFINLRDNVRLDMKIEW